MIVDEKYGQLDVDTQMFFRYFNSENIQSILEVGANEEPSAAILTDNGFDVTGVDLREHDPKYPVNFTRIKDDFVKLASSLGKFDCAFSTSAIEHFGLNVYGSDVDPNYDIKAMSLMYDVLKDNGTCYITVPYGKYFIEDTDWRVYNSEKLQERIVGNFKVEKKLFFL
jgi:hypothetical protein